MRKKSSGTMGILRPTENSVCNKCGCKLFRDGWGVTFAVENLDGDNLHIEHTPQFCKKEQERRDAGV